MAEAVVSVALETFRDLVLEEGKLLSGVGDKVKALQKQLKEMQSLLKDADGKQHESESVSVRNWIAEIRDLAYRAEDDIETYAVEVSSKRGRGLKKLLRRFSCIMMEFHSLHRLGSEISQIKSDLAGVSKNRELIEELCQIQKDKRCIVVLDDLWETHHWEGLKHAFVVEGLKSKIDKSRVCKL